MRLLFFITIFIKSLLWMPFNLSAQNEVLNPIEEYRQDKTNYQDWLDLRGIGDVLQVREIHFQKKGFDVPKLTIYLEFPTENLDTIIGIWKNLIELHDIASTNSNEFGELLFYSMINVFNIPPNNARIEIYDTYNIQNRANFDVAILYKGQEIIVTENLPKPVLKHVNIPIRKLNPGLIDIGQDKELVRENLYKKLFYFTKNYFKHNENVAVTLEGDNIMIDSELETLNLYAINLQNEVLDANLYCKITKWFNKGDCTRQTFEMLKFNINLKNINEKVMIDIEIDGRFGSGLSGETNWNKGNPMEPVFTQRLDNYTRDFALALWNFLVKKEFYEPSSKN